MASSKHNSRCVCEFPYLECNAAMNMPCQCSLVHSERPVMKANTLTTHTHTLSVKAIFSQVEFKQANLANMSSVERVFADDEGPFDLVFNLTAETKNGQSEEV